jgi:hypothetical protein
MIKWVSWEGSDKGLLNVGSILGVAVDTTIL